MLAELAGAIVLAWIVATIIAFALSLMVKGVRILWRRACKGR